MIKYRGVNGKLCHFVGETLNNLGSWSSWGILESTPHGDWTSGEKKSDTRGFSLKSGVSEGKWNSYGVEFPSVCREYHWLINCLGPVQGIEVGREN